MAEGWTQKVPCRYFASGTCREGENCRYSHNLNQTHRQTQSQTQNQSQTQSQSTVCRYFQRGGCIYGKKCRYLHMDACSNSSHTSDDTPSIPSGNRLGQSAMEGHINSTVNVSSSSGSTSQPSDCREAGHKVLPTARNQESLEGDELLNVSENWVNAPEFVPSTRDTSNVASGACNIEIDGLEGAVGGEGVRSPGVVSPYASTGDVRVGTLTQFFREVNHFVRPQYVNMELTFEHCFSYRDFSIQSPVYCGQKSYAEAVNPHGRRHQDPSAEKSLCPYAEAGQCQFGIQCVYLHGDMCDMCHRLCLHPTDEEQRKQHAAECVRQHERDMELSFAIARSKDKTCGICFEMVMEKSPREQRFGILPNCNHCFCLTCIRKWRQARQFDSKIIRSCPECRVSSDFVCPSMFWVDTKEDKDKLITDYKNALSTKDCKYFRQGRGKCPFGNKCFYLHAYPDGTKADVGPPERPRRRNADGDVLQHIILWDFLEDRESQWRYGYDDFEDLVAFFSDSEDSDWSDYDLFDL